MKNIFKNRYPLIIIALIIFCGFFLRTYRFSDWLHFETDQVDDTTVVSEGVRDFSQLPLLGPVAAGGPLRLGPAFYYFQYLGGKIVGNNPVGHASATLFFASLSMLFFFLLVRKYFSVTTSVLLLTLFSLSAYLVLYSRFSWNPNLMPFFFLSFSYFLLRSTDPKEKFSERYFLLSIAIATLATQMHFNAFFVIPLMLFFFLLVKRPRYQVKTWLTVILILLALYSPVIIHDLKTGGVNLKNFSEKFLGQKKEAKKTVSGTTFYKNSVITLRYTAYEYLLILSGVDQINHDHPKEASLGLFCDSCKKNLPWRLGALIFISVSLFLLTHNLKKETDRLRKDFLWLTTFWFTFSSLYFILILSNGMYLYPRFFLLSAPLAFIFLGFVIQQINPEKNAFRLFFSLLLVLPLVFLNLNTLKNYYSLLDKGLEQKIPLETEDIFPNTARLTLEQQILITDYIEKEFKNNLYPIYIQSESEYEPVFWYHLKERGIYEYDRLGKDTFYKQGNYFLIIITEKLEKRGMSSLAEHFDFLERRNFGSITIFKMIPRPEFMVESRQDFTKKPSSALPPRAMHVLRWKDIF